jgi:uncharacterized protein YbjT (DUF2867 family)
MTVISREHKTPSVMKKALIAGATGLIGSYLLQQLLESGEYQTLHVITRKMPKQQINGVVYHTVDFDQPDHWDLTEKIDDVFCTLGTTAKKAGSKENFRKVDLFYVENLAKVGLTYNAESFHVVSSIGAKANAGNFYLKTKGQMEEVIKALPFRGIFIYHPSLLLGPRKEFRFGEKMGEWLMKLFGPLMIGKLKKYKPVHASQVAAAMEHYATLANLTGTHVIDANTIRSFHGSDNK